MGSTAKKLFYLSLVLSVLIHFLFFGGVQLFSFVAPKRTFVKEKSREIEWMDVKDLKLGEKAKKINGQVVEQDPMLQKDRRPKDTKFLSAKNQSVEKESRAANNGRFQNHQQTRPGPQKPPGAKSMTAQQPEAEKQDEKISVPSLSKKSQKFGNLGDIPLENLIPSSVPKPEAVSDGSSGGGEVSQTDDHLKNIAVGNRTLLNSREFLYYSYYTRIKERIAQYWEPNIKHKMITLIRQGREIAATRDRTTQLLIVLDEMGKLVKVQVLGESGVHDLDDAAIEAFQTAAPFPNPPRGMVEDDGMIRIRWAFVVES